MENKKDIGKAFREKLNKLDKNPKDSAWNSINAELQQKRKRRIAFLPFWMKMAGILSLGLLVSFLIFMNSSEKNYFFTPKDSNHIDSKTNINGFEKKGPEKENYRVTPDEKSNGNTEDSEAVKNTRIVNQNVSEPNRSIKIDVINRNSVTNKTKHSLSEKNKHSNLFAKENKSRKSNKNKGISKSNKKKSKDDKTTLLSENLSPIVTENKSITTNEKKAFDKDLNIKKTDSLKTKIKKEKASELTIHPEDKVDSTSINDKSFDVFAYASPTYYGFMSDKSAIDSRLDSHSKTSKSKFSYGVYLSYEMTEKLSFRFGISKINLAYQTKNAPINTPNYSNISYSQNVSNASIYSQSNNSETMDIFQKLSYTEIPLEIKYNFYNKKFGIGAVTGLSSLFLNKNSVEVKPQNRSPIEIGKTKNLSDKAFSVNLGASFYYQFSEKLKLNVEPMLKYHLKDYGNGDNLKPYTFGIQTGLQYSFFQVKKNTSENKKK